MALDLEQLVMHPEREQLGAPVAKLAQPDAFARGSAPAADTSNIEGNLYSVRSGSTLASPCPGPWSPLLPEAEPHTVFLQVVEASNSYGQSIFAIIRYGIGQAIFQKIVALQSYALGQLGAGVERRITIPARQVNVSFYMPGSTNNTPKVMAAIARGDFQGPDKYGWAVSQFDGDLATPTLINNPFAGAGCLAWAHLVYQSGPASAAAPMYLMGMDAGAGAPTSGATLPIKGFVGDAMTGANMSDTLSDEESPGAIQWGPSGLYVALSTTPQLWTQPAAGSQVHLDLKWGQ
jgi:hypothetical protein